MQTFVPYGDDFLSAAHCLDNKRLIAQCKEAAQILSTLVYKTKSWSNHPIVRMWRDHEHSLCHYGIAMCLEYTERFKKVHANQDDFARRIGYVRYDPVWLHNPVLVQSHREALLYKNPICYEQYFPHDKPVLNYVWYDPDSQRYYRGKRSQPKTLVWL